MCIFTQSASTATTTTTKTHEEMNVLNEMIFIYFAMAIVKSSLGSFFPLFEQTNKSKKWAAKKVEERKIFVNRYQFNFNGYFAYFSIVQNVHRKSIWNKGKWNEIMVCFHSWKTVGISVVFRFFARIFESHELEVYFCITLIIYLKNVIPLCRSDNLCLLRAVIFSFIVKLIRVN